jgi:predicted MFS family arabinose efflux permease
MNGILLVTGNVAAIFASTPLAWIIQEIGWRIAFFFIAGIMILLAILSWIYIRDFPPEYDQGATEKPKPKSGKQTFLLVLR